MFVHRETVGEWIKSIEASPSGLTGFLDNYLCAKKGERAKRKLDGLLIERICRLREENRYCCGQKIKKYLKDEYGIILSAPTIYKVLRERYILRSKWKKNQSRGPIPVATKPREVVQMDSLDFGEIYAFAGIDIFTKEADIFLAPELTADYGCQFLDQSMEQRFNGFSDLIQTDGGPEFKDEFKKKVDQYCNRHRVARPYKKNEQSYIESFNRTVRKECLGWIKYRVGQIKQCRDMVESFLQRYHYHRPHMSLGMKPPLLSEKEEDCRISTEN